MAFFFPFVPFHSVGICLGNCCPAWHWMPGAWAPWIQRGNLLTSHQLQEINQLYETARQQMQTALSNLDNAIQFIADGAKNQPNRLTIVDSTNPPGRTPGEFMVGKRPVGGGAAASSAGSNPFGSGTSGAFGGGGGGSAFGQPSALGQRPNPFGSGTSGTSSGGSGAFGQPSTGGGAFGKPAAPAFGSTSGPGSAFGSASTTTAAFGQPSAFGQQSQAGGGAFGQPSAMGQRPSAFGTPAFGQTAQPTGGSAFGQPSQLGGGGGSAFGQPSALGQKPSPFGAPSTGSGGGFSAFAGSGASNASPFGAAAQPATSSPFGQASQPATSSPFGAAAQPAASSPFGAQPAASSPFGAGNGQPVANNPFGAAPAGGQAAPNPFAKQDAAMDSGMDAQPTSGFGQPQQQQQGSAFGQPQAQAAPNPFGQPTQSAFGAAPAGGAPAAGGANPYPPGSEKQHPPLESYATQSMGRLASWKGRPVTYKGDLPGYIGASGKWARIWFPGGPPAYYAETEERPDKVSEADRRAWEGFSGRFDIVPEVPPLRVDCRWDI